MTQIILSPPPLYNSIISSEGKLNPEWSKWFSNLYSFLNQYFPNSGIVNNSNYSNIFLLPSFSTFDRDNLKNISNGNLIYNLTTNEINAYVNGIWIILS